MSNKWRGLHGPITVEAAEAEKDRLFDRPPRPMSAATRALMKRHEPQAAPAHDPNDLNDLDSGMNEFAERPRGTCENLDHLDHLDHDAYAYRVAQAIHKPRVGTQRYDAFLSDDDANA